MGRIPSKGLAQSTQTVNSVGNDMALGITKAELRVNLLKPHPFLMIYKRSSTDTIDGRWNIYKRK